MMRVMILATLTVWAMRVLHGTAIGTGAAAHPDAYAVAAEAVTRLDSTCLLPEMIITAPRISDEYDYSYERYRYGRIFLQSASRRLIRIAGYMIMATMSVIWIALAISRIPHSHRVRGKKKQHLSHVNLARIARGGKP